MAIKSLLPEWPDEGKRWGPPNPLRSGVHPVLFAFPEAFPTSWQAPERISSIRGVIWKERRELARHNYFLALDALRAH